MGIFNTKNTNDDDKKEPVANADKVKSGGKATKAVGENSMKDLYADENKGSVVQKSSRKNKSEDVVETEKVKKPNKQKNAYRILIKPLVTEKATNLGSENKYVFAVNINANKIEIAKTIEEVYNIKPVSINVVRCSGKKVRYGRSVGKKKDWKKAIITLPAGKSINIYEGV